MKRNLSIFLVICMLLSCIAPGALAEESYTNGVQGAVSSGGGGGGFAETITADGTCGDNVYWALGEGGTLYIYGNGAMTDFATTSEIPWYSYKTQIQSVEVLDGVTYIGSRAFRDTYVAKAKFASSVTATGTSVFNSCSKLTSADLGGNIANLNNYVFYNCDALTSIDLLGVKTVGSNTFASCGVLASVAFYEGITSIGASAFSGDSKLSDLYYEGTADEWASVSIASGNTPLTALTPRGTVSGTCGSNLTWTLKGNNLIISGTGKMNDFASTSAIPWYSYKASIGSVTIEEGITYIGSRAFRDLNITEIEIPEGVTSTGSSIFNSCLKLKKATLPSTLKVLANYTFYNCDALTTIDLPYVTSIGSNVFGTCGVLKEIKVSSALIAVADNAFASSTKLTDIYYGGTEAQWNKISINSIGNAPFTSATVHYAEIPENIVAIGECGANLIWSLDTDGLLTISGTGAMDDFASTSEIPWYSYKSQIKSLNLENGITYIGNRAFRDLNITEIEIPEGVTSTGTSVFNNCLKLAKVTLPSTLKAVANYTFYNCDALTKVELPYVASIGANAFTSCSVLTEITLSNLLKSVGASAFASSTKLTNVYYDGTEEEWSAVSVESGNDPLNNATFHFKTPEEEEIITIRQPDNLRYKYGEPIDLTGVVIESSKLGIILEVTGDYSIKDYNPFITTAQNVTISCNGLSAVITVAGFNPFMAGKQTGTISYGGVSITVEIEIVKLVDIEIVSLPNKTLYEYDEELDNTGMVVEAIYSDGSREQIEDYKVSGFNSTVAGSQTLTVSYEDQTATFDIAVKNNNSGTCGENLNWKLADGVLTISGSGAMEDYTFDESLDDFGLAPWYSNRDNILSVVIENGVTNIGNYAFYKCSKVTDVQIADSVATIGDYAFYDCDNLTNLQMGYGVTAIGSFAFRDCQNLSYIQIPDSVITIGSHAFSYCDNLSNVQMGNNVTTIESSAFMKCYNLTDMKLPDSVISIGIEAFYGCEGLTDVHIGNGLTTIGGWAFYGCIGLTNIQLPDSVTTIEDWAFSQCKSLTSVEIGKNVTTIGYGAFCNTGLTDVYYNGTEAEWNGKVYVNNDGDYNSPLLNATFHFTKPEFEPYIEISEEASHKTEFSYGENFNYGLLKIVYYSEDGSSRIVSRGYKIDYSSYDPYTPGSYEIFITYNDCTISYWVTVAEAPAYEPYIEISENSTHRTEFMEGEPFDYSGLEVVYHDEYGNSTVIYEDELTVDYENYTMNGSGEIFVYYGDLMTSYWVDIVYPPMPDMGCIYLGESSAHKTYFRIGEPFDYNGLEVYYDDGYGNTQLIPNEYLSIDSYSFSSENEGWGEIFIEYNGYMCSYSYEVISYEWSIGIAEESSHRTGFELGEDFDASGLMLYMYDGSGYTYHKENYTVSSLNYNKNVPGSYEIFVAFNGLQTSYWVNVMEPIGNYIVVSAASAHRTEFAVGDEFDWSDLEILYYNEDGSWKTIKDNYTVNYDNYDPYTPGSYEIFVYYDGHTTSYTVYVNGDYPPYEDSIMDIMVEILPEKLTYYTGEELDLTGMVVTAMWMMGNMTDITTEVNVYGYEPYTTGIQTISVEYYYNDMLFTTWFDVEVLPAEVEVTIEAYCETLDGSYLYEGQKTEKATVGLYFNLADNPSIFEYYNKMFPGFHINLDHEDSNTEGYISADTVFKLYYERNRYTLTYVTNVDYPVSPEPTVHKYEETVVLPILPTSGAGNAFIGWLNEYSEEITEVTMREDVTVYANWAPINNVFMVTFVNWDGTVLDEHTVTEGGDAIYFGETPTKPADDKYTYKYTGWDKALTNITEDTVFTAQFDAIAKQHTVKFVLEDGTIIKTQMVNTGESATAPAEVEIPVPEGYVFNGWDTDFTKVTSDLTVTAQFKENPVLASGDCSENINWILYRTGVLEFTGSGEMPDYSEHTAPWAEYKDLITTVTLDKSMTKIGAYAFYYCINLTSVYNASNITKIGDCAFEGCEKLVSIDVAEEAYIAPGAFKGCTSMTYIPISGDREEINSGEFDNFGNVEIINIPEGVTTINENAFANCSSVTTIYLPSTIKAIHTNAFTGCNSVYQIYYNGTLDDWNNNIYIADGNECFAQPINFLKVKVTFVYANNDGESVVLKEQIIEVGGDAQPPEAPVKEGYKFIGWNGDYNSVYFDITIYATYESVDLTEYKIEYYYETAIDSDDYYKSDSWSTGKAYPGEYTVSLAKEIEHNGFKHKLNETLSELTKVVLEDGSTVFKAYYEKTEILPEEPDPITYKVTFKAKIGETYEVFKCLTVSEGIFITLPDDLPEYTNYKFVGWDGIETSTVGPINKDTTIVALYELITPVGFTVTFIGFNDEIVNSVNVLPGNTVSLPEAKDIEGYVFNGWYTGKNGSGTKFHAGDKVEDNLTLYAFYSEITAEDTAEIIVSSATAQVGNTITIDVSIKNNPGIASMLVNVNYNKNNLKLVNVTDGGILGNAVHSDNLDSDSYVLSWENDTATENITADGVIATLTFEVCENATVGTNDIIVSYDNDNYDIFDINLNTVDFTVTNGTVTVVDHVIGDVNGDGFVNTMDRAILSRYLSNWIGYDEINFKGADVNTDGKVNTLDRAILSRYLSNWTGYEKLPYIK